MSYHTRTHLRLLFSLPVGSAGHGEERNKERENNVTNSLKKMNPGMQ